MTWLRGTERLSPMKRSIIFEVITRLLFPVMILTLAVLPVQRPQQPRRRVRRRAGRRAGADHPLPGRRPARAGRGGAGRRRPGARGRAADRGAELARPGAGRRRIGQSFDVVINAPYLSYLPTPWGAVTLIGEIHFVTSLIFDIGVYLVVIGVMLDLARSLGSGIDQHEEEDRTPSPQPPVRVPGPRRLTGGDPMSSSLTLMIVAGVLITAGVYLMMERSLTRILVGVLLAGNGVNLLFLIASGEPGGAPFIDTERGRDDHRPAAPGDGADRDRDHPRADRLPADHGLPQLPAQRSRRGGRRRRGPADRRSWPRPTWRPHRSTRTTGRCRRRTTRIPTRPRRARRSSSGDERRARRDVGTRPRRPPTRSSDAAKEGPAREQPAAAARPAPAARRRARPGPRSSPAGPAGRVQLGAADAWSWSRRAWWC